MSFEKISLITLIVSFLGLAVLVYRKIPTLTNLSASDTVPENGFFQKIKGRIMNIPGARSLLPEVFLQKIISQARIWSLKADHKTANWLKTLRQKTQKKKLENGSYWQEIKNSKDLKK